MTTLPPFSGDEPTCTKCGNVGANTEYLQYGDCYHALLTNTVIGFHANERLHRACQRCEFQWDEAIVEPVHQGGNAEDCPACKGTNPDYPFICPGPAPAFEERLTKPAHLDGTPYCHGEIVAGGWEHCDYCRTWGRGWTPETPHTCPTEPKACAS